MAFKPSPFDNSRMINFSAVCKLLLARGPAAIGWFVVAAVFLAIKGHPLGARSHVCEKIGKKSPSTADFNSSSTVVFPAFRSWIIAALEHVHPGIKFRGAFAALRCSVNEILGDCAVVIKAATTSNFSAYEMVRASYMRVAAFTATQPSCSFSTSGALNCPETAKRDGCKVSAPHGYILTGVHV